MAEQFGFAQNEQTGVGESLEHFSRLLDRKERISSSPHQLYRNFNLLVDFRKHVYVRLVEAASQFCCSPSSFAVFSNGFEKQFLKLPVK